MYSVVVARSVGQRHFKLIGSLETPYQGGCEAWEISSPFMTQVIGHADSVMVMLSVIREIQGLTPVQRREPVRVPWWLRFRSKLTVLFW